MNKSKRAFSQDKDFIHNAQTFHHRPNNDLRTQSYNNFMTLSPNDAEKSDKLKDLLDFNSMKTDKHMRDTEAFLASRHYEPAEKFSNSMTMRGRFNTDKRPYKAKTKLDVNNDFLAEGEGNIPEMFKRPVEDFSENCDAHYKYGLLQIEKDMKARGSAFSAAENRLLQQIDELKNQRHIEKAEFYAQIEHYRRYLQMRAQAKKDAQSDNRQIWKR